MLTRKQFKIIRWSAKIFALIILALGLMFYFGYGNPLPFIGSEHSWFENIWLTIVPIVFVGLAVGWKNEKLGGFIVVVPLLLGVVISIIGGKEFPSAMLVAFIPGGLYLLYSYRRKLRRRY